MLDEVVEGAVTAAAVELTAADDDGEALVWAEAASEPNVDPSAPGVVHPASTATATRASGSVANPFLRRRRERLRAAESNPLDFID